MKIAIGFICVAAAFAIAAPLSARDKPKEIFSATADTQAKFEILADSVRGDMQPHKRYEFVLPAERAIVEKNLHEMEVLFERRGEVAQMLQDEKISLFNAQERVNSILAKRDGERLICERRKPLGSNIPSLECRTYAEVERTRNFAKTELRSKQVNMCRDNKNLCPD